MSLRTTSFRGICQRAARWRAALTVVLALGLAGCGTPPPPRGAAAEKALAGSRRNSNRPIAWTPIARYDFDDGRMPEAFEVAMGAWAVVDGRLVATEGERDRVIFVAPSAHDPVRVEFTAEMRTNEKGFIGDISVFLNARPAKHFSAFFRETGYAFTTGSFGNQETCFYRRDGRVARTETSYLQPRHVYRVAVEFDRGHVRYWLDGRILLEGWDRAPVAMEPKLQIALRTWDTRMAVDNLVISTGTPVAE